MSSEQEQGSRTTEEPEAGPIASRGISKLDSIIAKATKVHDLFAATDFGPRLAELIASAHELRHDIKAAVEARRRGAHPDNSLPEEPEEGEGEATQLPA